MDVDTDSFNKDLMPLLTSIERRYTFGYSWWDFSSLDLLLSKIVIEVTVINSPTLVWVDCAQKKTKTDKFLSS